MTLGLIFILGSVTFLFRLSFIALFSQRDLPPRVAPLIRLLPIAALTALAAPEFFYHGGRLDLGTGRWLAGVVAVLVAWRTRNTLLTLAVGMGVLWLWQFIRG